MRRREFITLLGSTLAWPVVARAQQREHVRRVGVLVGGPATDSVLQAYVAAFVHSLRQLGWTEGQNLGIDIRWNAGGAALAQTYAAQLIGLQPDVILAAATGNLEAVRQATSSIPVVFVSVSDPIVQGFVASLSRPGGNLTGFSAYEFSTGGKWLDLLKEVAPGLTRAGVVFNPDTAPQSKYFMQAVETAASARGMQAIAIQVDAPADIEPAIASFAREPNGGLIVPTGRLPTKQIAELADRHRLPAISWDPQFPRVGGLMCYSITVTTLDQYRGAAGYVDRILKGAKPGDLPIQQPDKYTLVINLKTAKALGFTVPLPLLGLADEVIE
jgi:putative tryptophan/tyrosine transport system substrate-binding protein